MINRRDKTRIKRIKKYLKAGWRLTGISEVGKVKCPHCFVSLDYKTFDKPTCRGCGKSYAIDRSYALVKEL